MFYRPEIDPHGLKRNPFKALVAPRPIAWVATRDAEGRANLAPFSFFNAVADAPPILMIAAYGRKPAEPVEKDTVRNILATREFSVSVTPLALKDEMNQSSAAYAVGVDEFEQAGLAPAACVEIAPPRVAASPVAFECRFLTRTELPSTDPNTVNGAIFGQVVGVHIDDAVIVDGLVDVTRYQPLARLGYMDYTAVTEVFSMERPTAPEPKAPG